MTANWLEELVMASNCSDCDSKQRESFRFRRGAVDAPAVIMLALCAVSAVMVFFGG